jgi:DNA-binding transcriptional ArsR family regulator
MRAPFTVIRPTAYFSDLTDRTFNRNHLTLDKFQYFYKIGNMKSIEIVRSLAALAQESRLAVFRMLVKRGPEGYTPTQLSEKLGVPAPTLSFHLKELQRAGLIEARRDGRFLFYSPNFTSMNELIGFLTANCCALADKDCGPACGIPTIETVLPRKRRA